MTKPDREPERRATRAVIYLMAWWFTAGAAIAIWLATARPSPDLILLTGPVTVVAVAVISPVTLAVLINSRRRRSALAMASIAAFVGFAVAVIGSAFAISLR